MDERKNEVRILAVVSDEMRTTIARQLEPLKVRVECVAQAAEIARLVSDRDVFQVAILPAELPNTEWWALWGKLSLLHPRPAILVCARAATFELWTSVLDLGGYDIVVEPFSDHEIQEAVRRAAQSFRNQIENGASED